MLTAQRWGAMVRHLLQGDDPTDRLRGCPPRIPLRRVPPRLRGREAQKKPLKRAPPIIEGFGEFSSHVGAVE